MLFSKRRGDIFLELLHVVLTGRDSTLWLLATGKNARFLYNQRLQTGS
jgi:hypothetical protein